MRCRDCPYGAEYLQKMMEHQSGKDVDDMEQFVWCDKVGGKIYQFGYCGEHNDMIPKDTKHDRSNKAKNNKYSRDVKYKNMLKRLYEDAGWHYPPPVVYVDEVCIKKHKYIKNPKPYYKRTYRSKRSKYAKRQSNKKIRKYKGELHNGYQHIHKLYDFWWELT